MPDTTPQSEIINPKIAATIGGWKSKLLDLTKRNRALNFRPNKVSTVTIVDEQAAEVFRLLCLQHKSLKFKARPETPEEAEKRKAAENASKDGAAGLDATSVNLLTAPSDEISGKSLELKGEDNSEGNYAEENFAAPDFVPYDSEALAGQYTDDYLQTNAYAEKLDISLRRLEEQARLSIEEQGINSLFLALGMLQYTESADSRESFKAPLILVPVELERRSARTGYTIKITDDEIIVNPSLAEYLRRNYKITLPELPDSEAMAEEYNLQSFLTEVFEAIKHQAHWTVKNEIQLALFSFQKLVMYKDLEKMLPLLPCTR